MSVRTSTVVASGLGLLAVIGIGTIFGDSIIALVAPPPTQATEADSVRAPGGPTKPPSRTRATAPAVPGTAASDGGQLSPPAPSDGSS